MAAARATPEGDAAPPDVPTARAVMSQAGGENFPVAMRILPRRLRRHLLAIYGFARLVDELGDELEGDRDAALDALEADVDRIYGGEPPRHPSLAPLPATVGEFAIPREPFDRLIAANRQDQVVSHYPTYADLAAYCELSANPVGRLVLHVLGAATPERVAWSDAICTALQLAEHWQDVREDRERGRVYLPQEDMDRFDVSETDLDRGQAPGQVRKLLAFEVERARRLLDEGRPLVRSLSGWGRLAVAGYVGGGYAALDAIGRAEYDVLVRTPKATKGEMLRAAARVLRA
jgi:squalene synthase HpnC